MAVASGGDAKGTRQVSTLNLSADADLQEAFGWRGVAAHADLLFNASQEPNDLVGSVQGVNNAAAGTRDVRLFQAWVEASVGEIHNIRAGFTDLNSEFDVADSAGLLMAPGFGIGGEFSGSGTAGPSIYPSSALGIRWRVSPSETTYGQAAVFNALAGVPGDRGGADFSFDEGVLAVGEAGWTGKGKLALGAWTFSQRRDDVRDLTVAGDPKKRRARGAYVVAEAPLQESLTAFVKVGVSDARTTDLAATWQAGVLLAPALTGRADSQVSLGFSQARFSSRARANARDIGQDMTKAETQFEATYSDQLSKHIAIQPDIQYVVRPYGRRDVKDALIVALRIVAEL